MEQFGNLFNLWNISFPRCAAALLMSDSLNVSLISHLGSITESTSYALWYFLRVQAQRDLQLLSR